MTEIETRAGGIGGFMTSVPGILTALAALVTAAGGIYVGVNHSGSKDGGPKPPVVVNLQMPPSAAPAEPGSVDATSLRGTSPVAAVSRFASDTTDPIDQLASDCAGGDAGSCADMLDALAVECRDGSGAGCDTLYELSPAGSGWEAYGDTCGGRFSPGEVTDTCSEQ
ncbi:MAG: hypothetical protein ABR511_06655 [Acidimicrobiales bacterium]